MDLLSCESKNDKEKLLASSQILTKAVKEGTIHFGQSSFPQTKAFKTKSEERAALEVLQSHMHVNLYSSLNLKWKMLLKSIGKNKDEPFYVTKNEFEKFKENKQF